VTWRVVFTRQAASDARKLAVAGLKSRTERLLDILREDPYRDPPHVEIPLHRIVHRILPANRIGKVTRMWTHYERGRRAA